MALTNGLARGGRRTWLRPDQACMLNAIGSERGRQAVVRCSLGRAAERPQRLLEAGAVDAEGFAADHHVGVLEAGVGQPEVVQPVRQRRAGHDDAEVGGGGEVWQAEQTGRLGCAKDLLVGTVQGAPAEHPAFQGAAQLVGSSGWRRSSSSKMVTGRRSGVCCSRGMTSSSKMPASGSGRRRVRTVGFWEGSCGSDSMR